MKDKDELIYPRCQNRLYRTLYLLKLINKLNGDRILKKRDVRYVGNSLWNSKPIPLEVHHIDGNKTNNTLENLMIVCPNCHAQTDNYKSKNKKS